MVTSKLRKIEMLYQMMDVENDKEPLKSRQNTIIDDAKRENFSIKPGFQGQFLFDEDYLSQKFWQ